MFDIVMVNGKAPLKSSKKSIENNHFGVQSVGHSNA